MKRYIWLVALVLGACNQVPQGAPEGDAPTVQPAATAWVPEDLGTLGGSDSYAHGTSANGSVVVGYSTTASGSQHAVRWTQQTTKDPQTLTFGELAGKTYGDAPFTVTATASSGLPVAFASDTPGVCTVSTTSAGGTVTLVAAGFSVP